MFCRCDQGFIGVFYIIFIIFGVPQLFLSVNAIDFFADVTDSGIFPQGLPGVELGQLAWSDYNQDGRLDFFMDEQMDNYSKLIRLYFQNSNLVNNISFPQGVLNGLSYDSANWVDYNSDSRVNLF